MRLIKITAPVGLREKIIQTAFATGIDGASTHSITKHSSNGNSEEIEVVDIETSTPNAKRFTDKLVSEDYYDPAKIAFNTRQPRAIISDQDIGKVTYPLCEPPTDLCAELWQFSHVTYGLILRVFVAACLLAYGMINGKLLLLIGGLLFLPLLPMTMAISYGIVGHQWKLAAQGAFAFVSAIATLALGGLVVAVFSLRMPVHSEDLGSPVIGIVISILVGIAAQLAAIDDAGRRELIGLAAASQIGLIPVWWGIIAVNGAPPDIGSPETLTRSLSFGANLVVLLLALMATQYTTGIVANIQKLKDSPGT